ncbi:MAG: hypothetical protein JWP35_4459 [Caulobacter sp.]|nr:hypothetical protein [Caulobacter sp.]
MSLLERLICQCIIEVYGRETHRSLNAAPARIWREQAAKYGIQMAADLPALDRGLAKMGRWKTLSREGVKHNGLIYRGPVVSEMLNRLIPVEQKRGTRKGSVQVKYKFHPEDLSEIYVWDAVAARYITLPCTQPQYSRGLSEHHHKTLKDFAAAKNLAFTTEEQRCAARVRLQDSIRKLLPIDKVRTRSRAQRLKENGVPIPVPQGVKETLIDAVGENLVHNATMTNRAPSPPKRGAAPKVSPRGRSSKFKAVVQSREPAPSQAGARIGQSNSLARFDRGALLAEAAKTLRSVR